MMPWSLEWGIVGPGRIAADFTSGMQSVALGLLAHAPHSDLAHVEAVDVVFERDRPPERAPEVERMHARVLVDAR